MTKIIDTPEQNNLKIGMAQISPVWLNKEKTIDCKEWRIELIQVN